MTRAPKDRKHARGFCLVIGGIFSIVGCLEIMFHGPGLFGTLFAAWGQLLFLPALLLNDTLFELAFHYFLRWLLFPIEWGPPL